MWADNETTEDFLNYEVHCDLIKEYITNPNLLPLTIGIFGVMAGDGLHILVPSLRVFLISSGKKHTTNRHTLPSKLTLFDNH